MGSRPPCPPAPAPGDPAGVFELHQHHNAGQHAAAHSSSLSTLTWRISQTQITTYIKIAIAMARAAGGLVILAGDSNAVQQTSDRQPSAHLESNGHDIYDRSGCYRPAVCICLAGRLPSCSEPYAIVRTRLQTGQFSRTDDFLCTRRCGIPTAAATLEQPEVLTDNI